jgi:cytoskeletal protein CcmA (bactofilin family)
MFNRKSKNTIDSLIGLTTSIIGDVHFKGGLRIDGHVKGNVIADSADNSMLVISEQARIEGEIRVAHLVVNGEILEMHGGAVVSGKLTHDLIGEPILKLAQPKLASSGT